VNETLIIQGLEWLSERIPYREAGITGDTYPITWGADDILYTSAGDPQWGCCSDDWGMDAEKIIGVPPRDWLINRTAMLPEFTGWGAEGPKPTGMLSVGGKLYLAIQNLQGRKPPAHGTNSQHGSDAGILMSEFNGQFWHPHKQLPPVMFPGHLFGGPAFINYGKDNAGVNLDIGFREALLEPVRQPDVVTVDPDAIESCAIGDGVPDNSDPELLLFDTLGERVRKQAGVGHIGFLFNFSGV